ncbi:MAG: protein-export chaperone SecB [Rhodospirillaceae bacterium]|jgi:preprotein translocase subunit SecB|nr:protein-export chaperone SecB [Rhodospirillaceae bacterium]
MTSVSGNGSAGDGSVAVVAQYMRGFALDNPNAPMILLNSLRENPQLDVSVDVAARLLAPGQYEVVLFLKAKAKLGDEDAFNCELSYGGTFQLDGLPAAEIHPTLFVDCPRLLFPFARSIIANATRDAGYPPLLIHPIDFDGLYAQKGDQAKIEGMESGHEPGTA